MIIRSLLLLLPLSLWAWYIIQQGRTSREITATFLGFTWAFLSTLMITCSLVMKGFAYFTVNDSLFYGVPLDWVMAQAIIAGALVPLLRLFNWNTALLTVLQAGFILLLMVSTEIELQKISVTWVVVIMTGMMAIPSMLLSDWTAQDINIGGRSILQSLAWTALLFWLFPSVIFHLTKESWAVLLSRDLLITGFYLSPMLLPACLLINALYQFAVEGDGTAFPYDPPKHLVTHGVYRYISNPMQVGITLSVGWWGIVIHSTWVCVSAIIAVILFIVFKDVCNGSCAIGLNNAEWEEYQQTVPKWIPRFKSGLK